MCCSLEDISDKYINMCDVNPRYLVQSKTYMHILHKVNWSHLGFSLRAPADKYPRSLEVGVSQWLEEFLEFRTGQGDKHFGLWRWTDRIATRVPEETKERKKELKELKEMAHKLLKCGVINLRSVWWAEHAVRVGRLRNTCNALVGGSERKGPVARPRHRREDNFKIGFYGIEYVMKLIMSIGRDYSYTSELLSLTGNCLSPRR